MAYKPKFIKQSALRSAAKGGNRRISADAIKEFDAFVGNCITKLVSSDTGKKTIDVDTLASQLNHSPAPAQPA